jgi:endonuclease-3
MGPVNVIELKKKCAEIHRRLCRLYGTPRWKGPENPLESMIWTVLSQNTNDVNSARAYNDLRKSFPRLKMMLDAPTRAIARAIRVGGLANGKSRTIKRLLKFATKTYARLSIDAICRMTADEAVATFCKIKGIGLKTVLVTLLFACGRDVFPVDTHIHRITRRLALVPAKASRDRAAELMAPLVPKGKCLPLHVNFIHFGRDICKSKPQCWRCPMVDLCIYPHKILTPPKN